MPINVKAMIVVLCTALLVFILVKPVFLRFMLKEDFERRRNLWLLLTAAGFLSPNFWIYLLVAAPMLLWASHNDSNPIALWFLTIFVVPRVEIPIPTVFINQLFAMSQERLLGLVVLLPLALKALASPERPRSRAIKVLDALLLAYVVYQLILFVPYEGPTNTMRRGALFGLDLLLPYYTFSRISTDRLRLTDTMAALCLACVVVAPLALFESARGWLLWTGINDVWGAPNEFSWLFRGDRLRSQLATGHSITMGNLMATALAFWFYLRNAGHVTTRTSWAIVAAICTAILVSYARATWIMAAMLPILMFAFAPARSANMFKGLIFIGVAVALLYSSPLGGQIADLLPFVGSGDQDTILYRQQLAETSWMLVQQNPLFGNAFAALQMENLRQGQGIIDLVNEYAAIAVFQGLVGLSLFVTFFFVAIGAAYRRLLAARAEANDLWLLGAALVSCMVSTMVFMATVPGAWFQWVLAGILAGYSQIQVSAAQVPREKEWFNRTRIGGALS